MSRGGGVLQPERPELEPVVPAALQGNNNTTAGKAAVGAAVGLVVSRLVQALLPFEGLASDPEFASAVVLITTWAFCQYVPKGAFNGGGAAAALLALVVASGCSTSRIEHFNPNGDLTSVEKVREFLKYQQDTRNARGGDITGLDIRFPVPFTETDLFRVRIGMATYVNAPVDTDFRVCQGLQTDVQGNTVGFDRCVEVNQLDR